MLARSFPSKQHFLYAAAASSCLLVASLFSSCVTGDIEEPGLSSHTRLELIDWHISGLAIINSPVAWVRVWNDNTVPISDIVLKYTTYDYEGHQLNEGTYELEGKIQPGKMKNFIELYLGLVDINSEQLTVQIQSVRRAE